MNHILQHSRFLLTNARTRGGTALSWVVLLTLLLTSACDRASTALRPADTVAASPPPATAQSPIAESASATALPAADSPLPTATTSSSPVARPQAPAEPVYTYEIVAEYPFDPAGFTQGLIYTDGVLYVGTGLYGQSSLRKTDLESGEVLLTESLGAEYFGEGIAVFDDKVYQLTWKENTGFIYDAEDFGLVSTFTYPTEGWGLTHDGERLIMSDGTPTLYFRDPATLEETGRITVTSSLGPLSSLNELEYVNGELFANIWTTDLIARIDPQTGEVLGWINLTGLLGPEHRQGRNVDVLNGIAYDAENDRLFVTGKLWPRLFEIRLVPAP